MGDKTSTGYCPPELARLRFGAARALLAAAASFDVWSFGVVLWELLAGRTLFSQARTRRPSSSALVPPQPSVTGTPAGTRGPARACRPA